jgi:hypothetical protein
MKQKTLFFLAAAISVLILAIAGGVVRATVAVQKAENDSLKAQIVQLQVTYSVRESEYNQMIDKANQDILEANNNMVSLGKQIKNAQLKAAQQKPAVTPTPAPNSALVSAASPAVPTQALAAIQPDAAQQAAQAVALQNSQPAKTPELVNFEGQVAYEVTFDTGAIYVGAQDGQILYNGTLPHQITQDEAGQIALKYLGGDNNQIVKTESLNVNGKTLWRTIVAAGHMVYVDTTGQVVYVQYNGKLPTPASN